MIFVFFWGAFGSVLHLNITYVYLEEVVYSFIFLCITWGQATI